MCGNSKDPRLVCSFCDIFLNEMALGKSPDSIKGYLVDIEGRKCIVLNSDLPEDMQIQVLWHEIGHAFMHPSLEGSATAYGCADPDEKEANLFSAEYQLSDEEVLSALRNNDVFICAKQLNVPYQVLDYKIRMLRAKGYNLPELPIYTADRYLGKI